MQAGTDRPSNRLRLDNAAVNILSVMRHTSSFVFSRLRRCLLYNQRYSTGDLRIDPLPNPTRYPTLAGDQLPLLEIRLRHANAEKLVLHTAA